MSNENSQKNLSCLTFVLKNKDADNFRTIADFCVQTPDVNIAHVEVLSPDKAVDVFIVDAPHNLRERIGKALTRKKIEADFCLQTPNARRKSLLICDMDSTLIEQECIDELADFAGVGAHVARITERAMRGETDFESALIERVSLLKNLPLSNLQQCFDERIHLNAGARTLCQTMKANGAQTVIVSGGFTFFTLRIAELVGFEHHFANTLHDDGKALLGTVGMPILGRDAKKQTLLDFTAGTNSNTALAIGDGANDLAMITAAGLGIAYNAKPIVAAAAHCAINHTDLITALYFQGYKDDELVG
ncbi:MAG: phosphoserine phosphatase SerB [Robiginitomaculum sp.]